MEPPTVRLEAELKYYKEREAKMSAEVIRLQNILHKVRKLIDLTA